MQERNKVQRKGMNKRGRREMAGEAVLYSNNSRRATKKGIRKKTWREGMGSVVNNEDAKPAV